MEKPNKKDSLFEPGTCVMLDGFVNKPEFNGMLGQIKKHIKDDTYRVMLSSRDAEIAVRTEFLKPVDNCPNSPIANTIGILVWPDVARSDYPGVQFFDYDDVQYKFYNPFDHLPGVGVANSDKRVNFFNNHENKMKIVLNFNMMLYKVFQKRLGWLLPTFNLVSTDRSCDIVFYDKASQGKPNRWFEAKFRKSLNPYEDIKGAFIMYEGLHLPVDPVHWNLNCEIFEMGTLAKGIIMEYNLGKKDMHTDLNVFATKNLCKNEKCASCRWLLDDSEKPRNRAEIRRDKILQKKRMKKQRVSVTQRQQEIEKGVKQGLASKSDIVIKPFK